MRQVKAREAGHGRPSRPAGRGGKTSKRAPQPRAGKKRPTEEKHSFDPEATLASLRETFPFRHPMLCLTAALVAFGAVAGLLAGGYIPKAEARISQSFHGTLAGAGFAVRQIHLSGNERTPQNAAFEALAAEQGGSIFAVDPSAARKRLMALPWVADAEVSRQLPDTLSIRLIEKRPFALWRTGNSLAVIERSGAVITTEGAQAFHLPVLTGAGAPEAAAPFLDAMSAFKGVTARVRIIERVGQRRWDLKLDGDVTVRLPEIGWEAQLAELERLIKENVLERDIEIIDLRYPDNYIFRLHNGDSRPAPRRQKA
jgi:cell division protein FtsQ